MKPKIANEPDFVYRGHMSEHEENGVTNLVVFDGMLAYRDPVQLVHSFGEDLIKYSDVLIDIITGLPETIWYNETILSLTLFYTLQFVV